MSFNMVFGSRDKERKNPSSSRRSFIRRRSVKDGGAPKFSGSVGALSAEDRAVVLNVIQPVILYLRQNGITTDGLFIRTADDNNGIGTDLGGSGHLTAATRDLLASKGVNTVQICAKYDVLTLANALKKIFKDLEQELLSTNVVHKMVQPSSADTSTKSQSLRLLLQDLPHKCFEIVKNLCLLLHECSSENDKLAYMFSALLLLPPLGQVQDPAIMGAAVECMKYLINECEDIFETTAAAHGRGNSVRASVSISHPEVKQTSESSWQRDSLNEINTESTPAVSSSFFAAAPAVTNNTQVAEDSQVEAAKDVEKVQVAYDFESAESGELTVHEGEILELVEVGDDDWSTVRRLTQAGAVEEGIIPTAYYEKLATVHVEPSPVPEEPAATSTEEPVATSTGSPALGQVVALYDFEAQEAGELTLRANETVTLLNDSDPDWWYGRNGTGQEGLFPKTYVEVLPPAAPTASPTQPVVSPPQAGPPAQREPAPVTAHVAANERPAADQPPAPPGPVPSSLHTEVKEADVGGSFAERRGPPPSAPRDEVKEADKRMSFAERRGPPPSAPAREKLNSSRPPPPSQNPLPAVVKPPKPAFAPPPVPRVSVRMDGTGGTGSGSASGVGGTGSAGGVGGTGSGSASGVGGTGSAGGVGGTGSASTAKAMPPERQAPALVPKPNAQRTSAPPGAPVGRKQGSETPTPNEGKDPKSLGWTIDQNKYTFYLKFFKKLASADSAGHLHVPGKDAADFLTKSGLERRTVARILELADIDRDGVFDKDEYIVAHHLSYCISKKGMELPYQLPSYLIPSSKRNVKR